MKNAIMKLKSVSMDVKNGLKELEVAIDVMMFRRANGKKAEEVIRRNVSEETSHNISTTGAKKLANSMLASLAED